MATYRVPSGLAICSEDHRSLGSGSARIGAKSAVSQFPRTTNPEMMVVGAPPPPYSITLLPSLGADSQNLFGLVRGSSRKVYEMPGASKKQSPPVGGIGFVMPSTLNQQLPRETIPK
jgi:hypothetical protein